MKLDISQYSCLYAYNLTVEQLWNILLLLLKKLHERDLL